MINTLTRRRLLAATGALVLVPALFACSDDDTSEVVSPGTSPGTEAPATGGLTLLRVTQDGGFVPVEIALGGLPLVLVSDGVAYVSGPMIEIYPPPALPNVNIRDLDDEALAALEDAAEEAGLLQDGGDYGTPPVADAPTTNIVIEVGGERYEHSIASLGFDDDPSLTAEQQEKRAAVSEFLEISADLDALAGGGHVSEAVPYVPDAYRLSVFAANPDDYSTDDGMEPTVVAWPIASLDIASGAECLVARGADAVAAREVFTEANQLTFFSAGDATFKVIPRPILPSEPDCLS